MNETFDSQALLATLTELPGVYRMIDAQGGILYVGKAKNLKKRVSSYFRERPLNPRIALMVSQIAAVETTATRSETEALLLESNLIKNLSPRYNILFRDDKSYPYIVLTRDAFPRLGFFRGSTRRNADYFGPFPSSIAVRESIRFLQKMFRLRTCRNSMFEHRSRPCLLYQIKRCSGACTGLVTSEEYARDAQLAALFLKGKYKEILQQLTDAMDRAAEALDFENAAIYRDQVQSLYQIRDRQHMASQKEEEADVIAVVIEDGMACVNLAMIRGGLHLGDKPQFPGNADGNSPDEILAAFLGQHYGVHPVPKRIYVNRSLNDAMRTELNEMLSALASRATRVLEPRQAARKVWLEMAEQNARLAIFARRNGLSGQRKRLEALMELCGLEKEEGKEIRIECFDVSHTQGESTVASCVVYQGLGMKKTEYRRFAIQGISSGDDYAALRQVIQRRYGKLVSGESVTPDLILIDGGKGQLTAARSIIEALGFSCLPMIGVAKGESRIPGRETLIFSDDRAPVNLPAEHPALHLIQEIRDEAHRFAISGHRSARSRARTTSRLEEIEGVGPKIRQALLSHFGGLQNVRAAGIDQLSAVYGVGKALALNIYGAFHCTLTPPETLPSSEETRLQEKNASAAPAVRPRRTRNK